VNFFSGRHGDFQWLEEPSNLILGDLIDHCPHVLLGRYLAVATLDARPFTPTEEESKAGWTGHNGVGYSPRLTNLTNLPWEQDDEWYLFTQPTTIGPLERFVNWGGFSLRDPQHLLDEADPTWDLIGIKETADLTRQVQERFWRQIERIAPESYIAHGYRFIFVSTDSQVYASVEEWARRHIPPDRYWLKTES
jgi:hypothetical protein